MQEEDYISRPAVIAAMMWSVAVGKLLVTATLLLLDAIALRWLIYLATVTVFISAVACALQIRAYAIRLASLIRAVADLDGGSPGGLRSVRQRPR